ncbi:MAG TPA: NADH-quinone oxidoreductase subunit C [Burkholderiaceae bacterium]|nr:NADH-quinone oxidoreductase subunit C [Burkholderiaceae bacterium]HQR68960.1 NADH-quinone oxidoreductase subunit C [Burkholderiaceae bacterium]
MPVAVATADSTQWSVAAQTFAQAGDRLVALWGSDRRDIGEGFVVHAAYGLNDALACVRLPLCGDAPEYPDISAHFPAALRMQRAVFDLLGLRARGAADSRPWLRHGAWPQEYFPLRRDSDGTRAFDVAQEHYAFVTVGGDGVHEIPVGPIHAGIIEPGHFRFSIVGEKVLRLEERLGYVHKGIEKRFEGMPLAEGHRLAGRVSGDSTVAYAWAYAMAAESVTGTDVPPRAVWIRALLLERERVANHLGDLGALGNDAALAIGLAQFSRLREQWLRVNARVFGHRLLMDCIVPGGVAVTPDRAALDELTAQCGAIEGEVQRLRSIYDEHAGLQDRFQATGIVSPDLAARLGLTGLAGRASGQARDLRVDRPCAPYDRLAVKMAGDNRGDVAARVAVRFDEITESLRLIRAIAQQMPAGASRAEFGTAATGFGVGWIEGWRGEVLVALETDGTALRRCHCHDPSWQNWPVLEHAVIGNIVPDFPLINKSFNLSYSGQDL